MVRLIDANALKQEIRKGTRYFVRVWDTKGREKWEMEKDLSLKEIDEIIDNAPIIDAEPIRHGKWIYKEFEPSKVGFYVCSECGYVAVNEKVYHYCYNCGARLEAINEDY